MIPHTSVHKLPECGHLPMVEQRELFLTITRSFLPG
jgi:pimeloyl-ACP methyl ester carboxylesterase